jgi:hypothetical protein
MVFMVMRVGVGRALVINRTGQRSTLKDFVPGILALLVAVPVALMIHLVNRAIPEGGERTMMIVGALLVSLLALPSVVYLLLRRGLAEPARLGLIALAAMSSVLVANYLYWVSFYVFFPADILTWSEGDFVNDILKIRTGYPIYSAQVNNDSFTYVPGTQLLTYALAWLLGGATSISLYRMIQLGYSLLAAVVAVCCCRELVALSFPAGQRRDWRLWGAVWLPVFFLIATNSLTNPFTHNLHNDALAQLVSVSAYWLLLKYVSTRDQRILALMAVIPAAGFLVKQNSIVWALLYCAHLAFFERPRSLARLASFTLVAFGAIGAVVGACYLLWSDHFIYWVFTVLGKHGISPLRSFQHILDVWPYYAIGILGGLVLLRGKQFDLLLSPWLMWLTFILLEAYTSGIAWMLNHLGPGCLIAGIWFLAALVKLWPLSARVNAERAGRQACLRAVASITVVALFFSGLGMIRIPTRPFSKDAYRYVSEIENEFTGQQAADVLLDLGTWVYLKDGVIMKDRAPSIGERGYSETGDFSGLIQRLKQKRYTKILVRNLHSPDFWYDHWLWRKSSGIKQALLENYHEVRRIPAVTGYPSDKFPPYGFSEVSILLPNTN